MGAGIDPKIKHRRIYGRLKTIERQLKFLGIVCKYFNEEIRGEHFVIYFAGIGPASNGESFNWKVLRFNPITKPESVYKRPGDIDYTDFHTRTIPEFDKGGYAAGIKAVLENQHFYNSTAA